MQTNSQQAYACQQNEIRQACSRMRTPTQRVLVHPSPNLPTHTARLHTRRCRMHAPCCFIPAAEVWGAAATRLQCGAAPPCFCFVRTRQEERERGREITTGRYHCTCNSTTCVTQPLTVSSSQDKTRHDTTALFHSRMPNKWCLLEQGHQLLCENRLTRTSNRVEISHHF